MADNRTTPYVPGDERNEAPNQDFSIDTTYHQGGLIHAVDYNLLADEITEVLDDVNQNSTDVLVGGFGYSVPTTLPTKVTDEFIGYAEWAQLLTAIDIVVGHQGTASSMPPVVAFGEYATAYDDAQTGMIAVMEHVRENRFVMADRVAFESMDGAMLTDQRTNPWTDILNWEFNLQFANFNEMRRYFNTGSEVKFSLERVGGIEENQQYYVGSNDPYFNSNVYANAWDAFLESIGTIVIGADSTYRPLGDNFGTFPVTTGFYGIIDTLAQGGAGMMWVKIYEAVGSYGSNEDMVEVFARLNAAPVAATQLEFRVTLTSESGPTYVDGTLIGKVDHRTSVNPNVPAPQPIFTTTTSLSVGEETTVEPPIAPDTGDTIIPVTPQVGTAITTFTFQSDPADPVYDALDQVDMSLHINNRSLYFTTTNREGQVNNQTENKIVSQGLPAFADNLNSVPAAATDRLTGLEFNNPFIDAASAWDFEQDALAMFGKNIDINNLWIWNGILTGEGTDSVLSTGGAGEWLENEIDYSFGWTRLTSTFGKSYALRVPSALANGGSPQSVYGTRYLALRLVPIYLTESTTEPAQPIESEFSGLGRFIAPTAANIQLPDNVYQLFRDLSFSVYL